MIAGVLVVAVTELLGLVGLLAPVPVGMVWGAVGVGCLARWHGRRSTLRSQSGQLVSSFLRAPVTWGVVYLFLGLTFVTGFFGAPNVWDGLTYHLPRVERWVEQGHLSFWPTSVDRQLWMAPWNGYAILQFRLLTGGDRLAFLPSWLAYLGCILVTARVVRQLGGDERQAALGALLFAAMPVAVLHASSVQTDLAAAFWVLCVAALALEAWQRREAAGDWRHVTWIGVAVGLAVATKGTVLLALVPWLVLYAAAVVHGAGWRALIRPLLVGACAVLVLNGAHFARNVALFGDPLGDPTTREFLRLVPWSVNGAAANLVANLSLHLGTSWASLNDWWTATLVTVQANVLRAEPSILYPYFGGFRVQSFSTHESLAGNPVHLFLGLGMVAWAVAVYRKGRVGHLLPWLVAGVAAAVLHGMLIRWQPYGARLQLASLVWFAPMAATLVRARPSRGILATLVVLLAIPAVMMNHLRPLVGERSVFTVPRQDQYFAERPSLLPVLRRVSEDLGVSDCRTVGLVLGYDTPEYLIQAPVLGTVLRLSHLDRPSASRQVPGMRGWEQPCAVLVMDRSPDIDLPEGAAPMSVQWVEGGVALLMAMPRNATQP